MKSQEIRLKDRLEQFGKRKKGTVLVSTLKAKEHGLFKKKTVNGILWGLSKDKDFVKVTTGKSKTPYSYAPEFWRIVN